MATRTTESTNTLENFRVNFNDLVTDIGNVWDASVTTNQLNTTANDVVGAINELFVGFKLVSQISGDAEYFLQPTSAETLTLKGGAGIHSGAETTNIVTDITAEDEMSFYLNDNIASLVSVQTTKIHPTTGSEVLFQNVAGSTNYQIKFASPGDTTIDYGSTQGFAAAMSVALG